MQEVFNEWANHHGLADAINRFNETYSSFELLDFIKNWDSVRST